MPSDQHVNLYFESEVLDGDTFKVVRFTGEEAISRPFRFEIELMSERPDIDLASVLGRRAKLAFQRGDDGEMRNVYGVLAEFEQGREGQYGHYAYRAVLVPRLWLLSLSRQNQIYQNKSAIEIVEEELKGAKDKGPAELAAVGLSADDFEFRLSREYAKREYVVQYQESDLDFVSRLLEHEGVSYFFEHDEERDKIVFCDDNVHFPKPSEESRVSYVLPSGTSASQEESVQAFSCAQRQVTAKMIVKDYNYRTPTTPLQGEADIDDAGHGLISEYGDHFKTPEEGQALAKVRAQEVLCRKVRYAGQSDRLDFAAGHPFTLEDHYNDEFNGDYVLTLVRHAGAQAFAEATGFAEIDGQASSYRNEFEAIGLDVQFRPARTTPKPRLRGVMNAHVDASGPGTRAEIDAEGRYKLVMPFDLSGQAEGKATRWVRMAQPYGGSQEGMHFPLRKGTEVIWTCVDGDPDRPIITGVVPNPLSKSVVTNESHTKSRIKSASGILIEMNDGPGPKTREQEGSGDLSDQQQMQRLDTAGKACLATTEGQAARPSSEEDGANPPNRAAAPAEYRATANGRDELARQQQRQGPDDTYEEADTTGLNDVWARMQVPQTDGNGNPRPNARPHGYLRLGDYAGDDTLYQGDDIEAIKQDAGQAAYDQAKADPTKTNAEAEGARQAAIADVMDRWNQIETQHHYRDKSDSSALKLNVGAGTAPLSGAFSYTEGNRTEITQGNREVTIAGKSRINIGDGGLGVWDAGTAYVNYMRKIGTVHGFVPGIRGTPIWRHTEVSHAASDTWQWGDSESGFAGFKFDGMLGLATSATVGGSLNVGLTADVDFGAAYNVNMKWGPNIDFTAESQNTMDAEDHDMIGGKTISLRIKPTAEEAAEKTFLKLSKATWAAVGATTVGALLGAGAGASLSYLYVGGGESEDPGSSWGSGVGFTAATAAWGAGLGLGIYKHATTDKFEKMAPARIDLIKRGAKGSTEDKIELNVGGPTGSSIVMTPTSITLKVGMTEIEMKPNQLEIESVNIKQTANGGPFNIKSALGGVTIKGTGGQTILNG
ncbi:MAG: type VI secretion system Vgr family protein [Kiloniellaceae bacterium]